MKKTKGKKQTRDSDLLFYKDLINNFEKFIKLFPLSLIIEAGYWTERDGIKDERELLQEIVDWYDIKPSYLKRHLDSLKKQSAILLELINALKSDLNYSIKLLLSDKQVPQIKKWFVDLFGETSERYLPDWKSCKGHPPRPDLPDFEKSYRVFVAFAKGKTCKEVGYAKRYPKRGYNARIEHEVKNQNHKSYKDLKYRVIPQGKIYFLWLIHLSLYSVADKEKLHSEKRSEKLKEFMKEIRKEYSPYEIAQTDDDVSGETRRKKPLPALGKRFIAIDKIIYPNPYDRLRSV